MSMPSNTYLALTDSIHFPFPVGGTSLDSTWFCHSYHSSHFSHKITDLVLLVVCCFSSRRFSQKARNTERDGINHKRFGFSVIKDTKDQIEVLMGPSTIPRNDGFRLLVGGISEMFVIGQVSLKKSRNEFQLTAFQFINNRYLFSSLLFLVVTHQKRLYVLLIIFIP